MYLSSICNIVLYRIRWFVIFVNGYVVLVRMRVYAIRLLVSWMCFSGCCSGATCVCRVGRSPGSGK